MESDTHVDGSNRDDLAKFKGEPPKNGKPTQVGEENECERICRCVT